MTQPPFSPVLTLLATSRAWEARLTEALKPLDLTIRKFGMLGHIDSSPGMSFSELARRSRITVQSTHTVVAALASAGWVDDSTSHAGARSQLRLTASGEATLHRATAAVADLDAAFAERSPDLASALHTELEALTSMT